MTVETEPVAEVTESQESMDSGAGSSRRFEWARVVAFGLLPALALLLTVGAAFLKWHGSSARGAELAAVQSVQAASDTMVALLSYQPDTVDRNLGDARTRLTGEFLDSYTSLTNDVVIPGAKQQRISAVATVPAAASVSASENHAVVMVFVNQSTIVGSDAPTDTASTVKVTLAKIGGRWLISEFEPV
jgi:Mce-associated membrane protein